MDSKIAIKQKSFFEIKKDINYLTASYPFLNLKILSSSTLGREIYSITLGKASEYVYFVSSFCGNDTLTSLILLRFLEDLSSNIYCGNEMAGVNIRKATSGKGIVFVPLINPDGHEIAVKGFSSASYLYNVLNKNCNCSHKDFAIYIDIQDAIFDCRVFILKSNMLVFWKKLVDCIKDHFITRRGNAVSK